MNLKVLLRAPSFSLLFFAVLCLSNFRANAQGFYADMDHWSIDASIALGKYTSYFDSPFITRRFLKHRVTYKAQSVGISRYIYDRDGADWYSLRFHAGDIDLHELRDESSISRRYGYQSRGVALSVGHRGPKIGAVATINAGKLSYTDELQTKVSEQTFDLGGEVYLGPTRGASVFVAYGGFNQAYAGSRFLFGLRYGMKRTDGTNMRLCVADNGLWADATFTIMEGEFTLNPAMIVGRKNFQLLLAMRYNLLR
ncbi:MAG: hypothetical protein AAF990_14735 [Bacteroidota bacterium]